MSEYVDTICGSVTKRKKGGDWKEMRKRIEDHTAKIAYERANKK